MLLLLAAYTLRISMKGASSPSSSPGAVCRGFWHQAGRYPLFSCMETDYRREAEKGQGMKSLAGFREP